MHSDAVPRGEKYILKQEEKSMNINAQQQV